MDRCPPSKNNSPSASLDSGSILPDKLKLFQWTVPSLQTLMSPVQTTASYTTQLAQSVYQMVAQPTVFTAQVDARHRWALDNPLNPMEFKGLSQGTAAAMSLDLEHPGKQTGLRATMQFQESVGLQITPLKEWWTAPQIALDGSYSLGGKFGIGAVPKASPSAPSGPGTSF